jgi:hypothetical protein
MNVSNLLCLELTNMAMVYVLAYNCYFVMFDESCVRAEMFQNKFCEKTTRPSLNFLFPSKQNKIKIIISFCGVRGGAVG